MQIPRPGSGNRSSQAVERWECRNPDHSFPAAAYMACAPKSNAAVNAIFAAMDSVKHTRTTVPAHLQDAHYGGHEKLGYGIGYKYAHDYPNHYVKQQYLPDELVGHKYYYPKDIGEESRLLKKKNEKD